jgi:hypothetical protein
MVILVDLELNKLMGFEPWDGLHSRHRKGG